MRALTEPGRIAFAVTATDSQKGRQLMKEMKEGKCPLRSTTGKRPDFVEGL